MNRFIQAIHYSFILTSLLAMSSLHAENTLSPATVPQQDAVTLLSGFDSLPPEIHRQSLRTTITFNQTANAARFDQAVYDALHKVEYAGLGDKANQYLIQAIADGQSPVFNLLKFIDNTGGGKRVGGDSGWLKIYFGNINTNSSVFCLAETSKCAPNAQGNPRPFQVSSEVHLDPRYSSEAINSAAFPSGHSTDDNTQSLLLAVMAPERYQQVLARAADYQNSRMVLGVHYALDVMGGRILATEEVIKLLNNTSAYLKPGEDFAKVVADGAAELHAYIQAKCGVSLAQCAADSPNAYSDYRKNKLDYHYALTYGLPPVGPVDLAPVVPVGAEVLLASRFPYLSASQRRDILATTELPSGYPLDNGTGYARLNLFAAADGYGAFSRDVSVFMDAALGGFNAADRWNNDISGAGGLTLTGTGRLTLSGNNTYTGKTLVHGGSLEVAGVIVSDTTVQAGGTLTGTGKLSNVIVGSHATLAPGAMLTLGSMTLKNLTIAKNATLHIRVNSTAYDAISAMGKVTLAGGV